MSQKKIKMSETCPRQKKVSQTKNVRDVPMCRGACASRWPIRKIFKVKKKIMLGREAPQKASGARYKRSWGFGGRCKPPEICEFFSAVRRDLSDLRCTTKQIKNPKQSSETNIKTITHAW